MPNKLISQEVAVDAKTTALLVLDLNARCEIPRKRRRGTVSHHRIRQDKDCVNRQGE